jgi:hypothetical protein
MTTDCGLGEEGVDDIYSSLPMDTAGPGLSDGEIQVYMKYYLPNFL